MISHLNRAAQPKESKPRMPLWDLQTEEGSYRAVDQKSTLNMAPKLSINHQLGGQGKYQIEKEPEGGEKWRKKWRQEKE